MNAPWPGPLGPPPDAPAMLALAATVLFGAFGRVLFERSAAASGRRLAGALAVIACALSLGYVDHYLRGGPRIIDATSYWLEGRALAEGHVTWPSSEPSASMRGRFLLTSGSLDAPRLAVIFPPGYPAALALGFLAHLPLAVGPAIAGLLVLATYTLGLATTRRRDVAVLAACLSVLCGALRYHTADTMSHGLAALLVTTALALVFRAAEGDGGPGAARGAASDEGVPPRALVARAAGAGFAAGWLFATRPVTALALAPVLLVAARRLSGRGRAAFGLAAAVPVLLFFAQQHAAVGEWLRSSQAAYYSLADGPPGCFRYGFGRGIGCLHEHGSYVANVLPAGHSISASVVTTLRRLRLHLIDVGNAEPLAALVVAAPWLALRRPAGAPRGRDGRRVLAIFWVVPSVIAAYAPFYFDGSYPGGGARFYADVLPLEHVLIAAALGYAAERGRGSWRLSAGAPRDFAGLAAAACALSALGFAVHASYEHVALRERDGGRPFFEPAIVAKAGIDRGLLFVGTDHAFNLAFDPEATDAAQSLVVRREFGDDRDFLLWDRMGRPPAYRYVYRGALSERPEIVPFGPARSSSQAFRFEAEAEWPPLAQKGGRFEPVFAQGTCAWGGSLLALRPDENQSLYGVVAVPIPYAGRFRVAVHVASRGSTEARLSLRRSSEAPPSATWTYVEARKDFACATLLEVEVDLASSALLELEARGDGELFLDAVALGPATTQAPSP